MIKQCKPNKVLPFIFVNYTLKCPPPVIYCTDAHSKREKMYTIPLLK